MWEIFEVDATRAVVADWVELELHRTGRPFYTDAMLQRDIKTTSEPEQQEEDRDADADEEWQDVDPEILDEGRQSLRDSLWEELTLRQERLGAVYPFELTALRSGGWRLASRASGDPDISYAQWMYLTTLTMAGFRHRYIRRQRRGDPDHRNLQTRLEKQFQHISALAASNYFGSDTAVYSFGWPRKDGSDFQDALKDLATTFGDGKVRKKVPANSKGHEKDGTVDLVVWRVFANPSPADPLVYGQVASGKNWRDKPVQTYLSRKFLKWFKHPLTMHWLGATFMPFVAHTDVGVPPRGFSMDQAIAEEARDLAAIYGHMFDRLKLAELFSEGLREPGLRFQCEDPTDVLVQGQRWIQDCFDYCAQAEPPAPAPAATA